MKKMSMMSADFKVEAMDKEARTFEGSLSTSHLDLGDGWEQDIVWPGAFKRTISFFEAQEDPYMPLLDSHDRHSIFSILGHMTTMEERLTGKTLEYDLENEETLEVPEMELRTSWQIIEGKTGGEVMDRLRPGSLRKMSMGYRPIEFDNQTLKGGGSLRNLREVALREGSLVVFGMNPDAEVTPSTVKSFLARLQDEVSDEDRPELVLLHDRLTALLKGEDPTGLAVDDREAMRKRVEKVLADSLLTRISAVRRTSASVAISV